MNLINWILGTLLRTLISLRYRLNIEGESELAGAASKSSGILFLPNHPALIDPILIYSLLVGRYSPRTLMDKDQLPEFIQPWMSKTFGIIFLHDVSKYGAAAREAIEDSLTECSKTLQAGQNLLLYPSGHIYKSMFENLRGNTAVERILQAAPQANVVLLKTTGLWGSSFSWASGKKPLFFRNLREKLMTLLMSGIFFAPKRKVTIRFQRYQPKADASRSTLNLELEAFYNLDAPPAWYVPYTHFDSKKEGPLPEPELTGKQADASSVPPETRKLVLTHLAELTGRPLKDLKDSALLAQDLGLDSLSRTELAVWIEESFGLKNVGGGDAEALQTVADLLLAACGEAVRFHSAILTPPSQKWFKQNPFPIELPFSSNLADAFLKQARRGGVFGSRRAAIADPKSGVKSYQDILTAIYVLKPLIEKIPGKRIGIMLPATVTADIVMLAVLFAGKTPVFVNWTVGRRQVEHSLSLADVSQILTAKQLLDKLHSEGADLAQGKLAEMFIPLETLASGVSTWTKILALLKSFGTLTDLKRVANKITPQDTAAVLFTSGSEALPKAVPLSHANLLSNIRSVFDVIHLNPQDSMLGMLPPFHSFGLTITSLAPLCAGIRVVHYANPMEAEILARIIESYEITLMLGTPTFLSGICRAGSTAQLKSVRIAVTGAEKCSERVYAALKKSCPQAIVAEGYGITECSPVVAINPLEGPKPYSIGRILPSLQYQLDKEEPGMLLVRGPSIFSGYLKGTGESPFVERDGHQWYRTGDLVQEDADGFLFFKGRKKRFVKMGGEMVSLPAIEEVLEKAFVPDGGLHLAVESDPDQEHPELTLFTTLTLDRAQVNQVIQKAGLSGLHQIRKIQAIKEIPVLGTGKTDYRALKALLKAPISN